MKLSKQTLVIIILSVFVCALFGFIIWWQAESSSEYSAKPDDLKSVYEYVCSARGTYHPNEIELSLDEASGKIKLIYKRGSEKLVQKLLARFEKDGISPDYFELVELYFQNQPLIEELDDELDDERADDPGEDSGEELETDVLCDADEPVEEVFHRIMFLSKNLIQLL